MSFEAWLAWHSRKYPSKQGVREFGVACTSDEIVQKSQVYPRADLDQLKLSYDQKARLGLADVEPKGILFEKFS